MNPGISVIICCYNSEQRIAPTLQHLAAQELGPELPWEIILVDNCCTDNTVATAKTVWADISSTHKPPIHFVKEDQPGLSRARQKGLFAAKYDTICFCDDDNWLHRNYLTRSLELMNNYPEIGILVGQGIPTSSQPIPDWFEEHQMAFACGKLSEESGELTNQHLPWGAGMILRNKTLRQMYEAGFNHLNADRKGNSLSSGGDTELCYWHLLCGKKLWYDDKLILTHFIAPERLSVNFAKNLHIEHEKAHNNLFPYISLIYSQQYQHTPKIILFARALISLIQRNDGTAFFVHLQPIFNFRLPKKTQEILHYMKNYQANFQSQHHGH